MFQIKSKFYEIDMWSQIQDPKSIIFQEVRYEVARM